MNYYFERNQRWLKPVFGGLVTAISPILMQVIAGPTGSPLPVWLPFVGLAIAGFGAGLGAMFTDTTSAHIARFVGTAAGFAVILHSIFA
jgi:hypothetical protein